MTFIPDAWLVWWQGLPFTQPFALILAVLLPLAFLVLLLRNLQMKVGSLLLFRDLPQRVLFQNFLLEHQWHRWLYVGIFAVLILIAAGLSLPQPNQRHVIVIDDSASMSALIDPNDPSIGTVWDQATAVVARTAQRAQGLGQAVVLVRLSDFGLIGGDGRAGTQETVRGTLAEALDDNRIAAQLDALANTRPRALPMDVAERVKSLGGFVGAQGVGRLTIVTDRPLDEQATLESGVVWVDVTDAVPKTNLGFVAVRERQDPFDRSTQVVLQNLSRTPITDARLELRSINNPVSVPVLTGINLAPNAQMELDAARLRARAEILGAGPLRLSVVHPDDALPVDNHLWLVNPSETQMNVAMVRCQGDAPLFDQLLNVDGLRFQNFGDITSLAEVTTAGDPIDNGDLSGWAEASDDENRVLGADLLADQQVAESQLQSFDLVIYDRCLLPPLYEELATDSIVVEVQVNSAGGSFDRIDPSDAEAVVRVGWQAPSSRSPLLAGVRSLVDLPLVSQTVRPLPQAYQVVGLLSDLDPNQVAGQAEQDVFAPSDLLQAFVAWGGAKTEFDLETGLETTLPPDVRAPKMLYLGFDPHLACARNVLEARMDDVPLAEASAAAQNGPDDCLALTLLVINSIEWMRTGKQPELQAAGLRRQYLSTGESFSISSTAIDQVEGTSTAQREILSQRVLKQGQSGASRVFVSPLATGAKLPNTDTRLVRWQLSDIGLHTYRGTRGSFDLSVGLLNAAESRLDPVPFTGTIKIEGAAANADRQDLSRLLVILLLCFMVAEAVVAAVLPRWRRSSGLEPSDRQRDNAANNIDGGEVSQ